MAIENQRRSVYRASLAGPDYFVVLHLKEFLERSLREQCARGMRVADIGCGEQPYRSLVQKLGATYVGYDIAQNRKGTVEHLGPITDIPAEDASYDLVLCSEVLEHTVDPGRAIEELARILNPGGRLILTTPFAYPLHEEPYDFFRLTPNAICILAERCGLHRLKFEQTGNELEVIATVWCNLWSRLEVIPPPARRIISAAMRLPVNVAVTMASRVLGRGLPSKYYLSNAALFEKPTSGNAVTGSVDDRSLSDVHRS